MAAFILAALISALFTLPAQAVLPTDVGVAISSAPASGSNVKVGSNVVYTITVTNTDIAPTLAADVVVTDNLGSGVWVTDDGGVGTCDHSVPGVVTCTDPLVIAASGTWVFHITVAANALGALTNNVSVTETGDGDPANNTAAPSTTTVVAALADVTIAKNHAGTLTPGSDVTYNLVVSNAGPDTAAGVVATDTLAAGLTFKSSSTGCLAAAQVVTCAVPSALMGTPQTETFIATIGAAVTVGTVITNTAGVITTTAESNAGNNTSNIDSITVGAASVDLGVAITVLPTTAAPGDTVTYTVTVTNPSTTTDATNVVVTDALPPGLTAVTPPTAGPTGTTTAVSSNTWTWTIPTVAKATSGTTPTVVTASFGAIVDPATTLTTITNTATMTATQTDPTPANNTASVDLTVSPAVADLDVLTAVDNSKPNQGDKIAIAIQVSNAGPDDATNVVLKDVLPTGLKYDSCSPCKTRGLRRSTSRRFTIALIPANSAATLILNVTVQASSGTLKNTATIVSADQSDPIANNDKDTLSITIGGTNNSGGGGSGGTGGTSGGTSGTGGTAAFTGFTAGQLMPWFLLLFSVGLAAIELSRRRTLVSPIGFTYGFEPPF